MRSMISVRFGKPGQRVVQRLVAQLAGSLTDQPQCGGPTGAQHQHQRGEDEACGDAGQQNDQRAPIVR